MSATDSTIPQRPRPTVFLSYASEDRAAAQLLRDALPALGLEVWHDESDLVGGDAWDRKIRRQIRECDYFMPVVSARTEARREGYFRREWRFAVERTLDMADDHVFLLPVVIDDTTQAQARVPEKFLAVQWLRAPGGHPNAAFEALCRRLAGGQSAGVTPAAYSPPPPTHSPAPTAQPASPPARREYPAFPREEPGQRIGNWLRVIGWLLQSAWVAFGRWPRWVRICAYVWIAVVVIDRTTISDHDSKDLSPDQIKKIAQISQNYHGGLAKGDLVKLGADIASAASDDKEGEPPAQSPLLAIPFGEPDGDPAARKLAETTFAQLYGRMAVSHRGQVTLTDEPLSTADSAAAVERGREHHSKYVVFGAIGSAAGSSTLTVSIATVADGSVLWSKSYPIAGGDPAQIATEVTSNLPKLDSD